MGFVRSMVSKGADHFRNTVEEFIDFKKRLQRFIIGTGIMLLGFVIIIMGVLELISFFFPGWEKGLIYMLLGLFLVLGALVYRKYG